MIGIPGHEVLYIRHLIIYRTPYSYIDNKFVFL